MLHDSFTYSKYTRCLKYLFIPLLMLLVIPPDIMGSPTSSMVVHFQESQKSNLNIFPKVSNLAQNDNPDSYFPNFLNYSISVANAMIDNLYDDESGGFYLSIDQFWSNTTINKLKYSYDQAQAILALLKLSEAVINDSERDLALHIAEMTGNYMITRLYDDEFGGFLIGSANSYKKPGINGKAIQSLLSLYKTTDNITYRDKAIETFEFIDNFGWDSQKGGYFYLLSHSGDLPLSNPNSADPYGPMSKRADHNAIIGQALLDLYLLDSEPTYLDRAIEIYQIINTTCRNSTTGLFYIGFDRSGEIVEPEYTDIFINSLMLEFLSQLYNVTSNSKYLDDFQSLINAVLLNFWDGTNGGLYATYSYNDQVDRDEKKYSERQFYVIRALDEAYKMTNNNLYYNLILDIMEFLNNNLYDNVHEGYYLLTNADGSEGEGNWKDKYSVTQSLAIYELANLWLYSKPGILNAIWSPSNPRPTDNVTIMVAAFDADGLSNVLFNYSMNNQPYKYVEMVPYALVKNMFETTLSSQPHGTTVNFNIIVNDTLGSIVKRETYFFVWEFDVLPPHVRLLGVDPGDEISANTNFSITVSAHDRPSQGVVTSVRMYYQETGQSTLNSRALYKLGEFLWRIEFPNGFREPNRYVFYFEAIDNRGNFGFSSDFYLNILGQEKTLPVAIIVGGLFFVLFIVPAGVIVFKEYNKKSARTTLKNIQKTRGKKRRRKRGTRRTS